jgi:hypothetical protein
MEMSKCLCAPAAFLPRRWLVLFIGCKWMVDPKARPDVTLPVPLSRCPFCYFVAILGTVMVTWGLAMKIQVTWSSFVIHRIMFTSN